MKKKSWEPFGSCLLNSTANPAQFLTTTKLTEKCNSHQNENLIDPQIHLT